MSASNIMLICKRKKCSGSRVRNTQAFGNFSNGIPRWDIPNNNFASHARIHIRYTYIPRATDGEESSKINDSVKFSARFRTEDAIDQRSGGTNIKRPVLFFMYFRLTLHQRNLGRAKPLSF